MTKFLGSQKKYCTILYLCIDSTIFMQTLCIKYMYYRNSNGMCCVQPNCSINVYKGQRIPQSTACTKYHAFFLVVRIGSPTLSTASVAPPPFGPRGETHLLAVYFEMGGPNSDEETDTLVLHMIVVLYTIISFRLRALPRGHT